MTKQHIQSFKDNSLSSYLAYVYKIKMLSEEEEQRLALDWSNNNNQKSAQQLMISHLPLVVKVAYSFKNYGQPVADLISEGNIGLMKAIYKFDPNKGFRLSTYAVWWIKAYITDYILNTWSLVKSGSILGRKKLFFSLRRIKSKLGISTNSIPDDKVLAISKELNVSTDDVKYVNNMLENKDMYLEAPINNDFENSLSYGDLMVDTNISPLEDVEAKQEESNLKSVISKVMGLFNEREKFIIEKRFLDDNPMSLNAIGEMLNLSRERIRQIEKKALEKAKEYIVNKAQLSI
ncbi:RNA polymerase factor sigma-32 [Rickettsiales bacterium LUAb2]